MKKALLVASVSALAFAAPAYAQTATNNGAIAYGDATNGSFNQPRRRRIRSTRRVRTPTIRTIPPTDRTIRPTPRPSLRTIR